MDEKVRINKFISTYGDLSRRKADEYILQGRVTLNNITVEDAGLTVDPSKDKVRVDGELIKVTSKKIYIALHKPAKVITSVSDEKHRTTVIDLIKIRDKIFPVGRLDYESTGLLLLTNDGDLNNRLLHPKYDVYKTYYVKTSRPVDDKIKALMEKGFMLEGKRTKPAVFKFAHKEDRQSIYLSITEGRNRQVRKMFEKFGIFVNKLHRTEYGPIKLGTLKPGEWRFLNNNEIEKLKNE